jgi:spectinomycin phosphotransferase
VREPPTDVSDEEVLAAVNAHWDLGVDRIGHLPVGFGAHHWRASGVRITLFITLDTLAQRHTAESLEAAYAGAAGLASDGLEFVLAPLATTGGHFTAAVDGVADRVISVTPWRTGTAGSGSMTSAQARATRALLDRLHATAAPTTLPRWQPLVGPGLADDLARRTSDLWAEGPHGERAREGLREHLHDIERWTADYHRLAALTDEDTWVPTHGEPHTRNQLTAPSGTFLVDWESLKLAPRERDLRTLDDAGHPQRDADEQLLTLFDLEWRLDEISQYADRFEAPHHGTESDAIAYGGLMHELTREGRHTRRASAPPATPD